MNAADPKEIETYFDRLWSICRSITGNGVRKSLDILSELVPLRRYEIPSGTAVFDWTVPREWNVEEAYIVTPSGAKICDLRENNLHLVGYSLPVDEEMSWEELAPHLHTRPELPEAIPYLTSYYKESWGFCLSHREWLQLPKSGRYRVVIKSSFSENGSLTIADALLPGKSEKEILFSTYLCHPSMANNELSGPLAAAFLYRLLAAEKDRYFTYRFVFTTETIGTLAYLHQNGGHLKKQLVAGYVLTCCGDRGDFTFKRSRNGNSLADTTAQKALENSGAVFSLRDFEPWGSDERQYCSPGFNLPVGVFMRTPFQEYAEYHTSLDNKSFLSFESLAGTVTLLKQVTEALEQERVYTNTVQMGEPLLGKRNLYEELGKTLNQSAALRLRLRLLNFCDGSEPVSVFIKKYGYDEQLVIEEAERLLAAGLLSE